MSTSPEIFPVPIAAGSRHKAKKTREAATFPSQLVAAERQSRKPARRVRKPARASVESKKSPTAAAQSAPRISELTKILLRGWWWLGRKYAHSTTRALRVTDIVSLGEKRFAAVLDVDGQRFLIGGGTQAVSLLTQLRDVPSNPAADGAGDSA